MARLAFIGDCHLGYRHKFRAQRLRDYAASFDDAVGKALILRPDVMVFLGDIVHHPRPDPVTLRTVLRKLIEVAQRCPVVVCIGNHEIEGHLGTAYPPLFGDVHENISVLTTESPHVILEVGGRKVGFHGFEYIRGRERAEEALKKVSAEREGDVNVLCLHQAVERYGSPHEISLAALREAAPRFDLVMCGHIHRHQPIREVSDLAPAWYCGSTERISFNESENPTGFMFFDGDLAKPSFVETQSAPMTLVRRDFRGTPAEANRLIEGLIRENPAKLLKIELSAELEGDTLDLRRDWSAFEDGRTVLEVSVSLGADEEDVRLEKVQLNEDLIREYFDKSGNRNRELEELCVGLFRKYGL
jgi:DNA repair exonuclease SbcCD nuclease subunit